MDTTSSGLFKPSKPLSDYVEFFWYFRNSAPPLLKERLFPSGTVEIVFRLGKDHVDIGRGADAPEKLSGAVFSGPQSKSFVLDKSQQDELVAVHFRPGGIFPFLDMPADEVFNHHLSLELIWRDAGNIRADLIEAPTMDAKFHALEKRLLQKLNRNSKRHPAVAYALRELTQGRMLKPLGALANEVNLSSKRLTQLFSREVGVTPKLFQRTQRFQKIIETLEQKMDVDWIDLALSHGYFDQAHFNHEFQEFTGISPSTYMSRRNKAPDRIWL